MDYNDLLPLKIIWLELNRKMEQKNNIVLRVCNI